MQISVSPNKIQRPPEPNHLVCLFKNQTFSGDEAWEAACPRKDHRPQIVCTHAHAGELLMMVGCLESQQRIVSCHLAMTHFTRQNKQNS
jgi:hypothetical protein